MRLYLEVFKLLLNKLKGESNGEAIKKFALNMGIVYIKLAQILATQNFGNLFTEDDRQKLSSICDDCNPISYEEIEEILKREYKTDLDNIFSFIEKVPAGSASVSQVHRAILKSGEEVAIKIKRQDITQTVEDDLNRIRNLIHILGRIVNFRNFVGSDHALDLYLNWIKEEIDFRHEMENIKIYYGFACNVNGKFPDSKLIRVPKLYPEYCTDNVIVMEFIKGPTISKLDLNEENKERILLAINSYIKASFWALFNDKTVVYHCDPHVGNLVIDDDGNICFLDMGLLYALNEHETNLCREFFLTAYSGNYEKLYSLLVGYGDLSEREKEIFKLDCKRYCAEAQSKDVTHYFMDLVGAFTKCELNPPTFLFYMAKAFICLNGISHFIGNDGTALELLGEQTIEFMINRSIDDLIQIAKDTVRLAPTVFGDAVEYGTSKALTKLVFETDDEVRANFRKTLEDFQEMLALLKLADKDSFGRVRKNNSGNLNN
ncbi:MAG: AarF/ABC1/UbiB kinase family protein [Ruminococcus sp.]|nr:AarF/ABC1/UbiB kinase family protein [Ruminococcus sp.]